MARDSWRMMVLTGAAAAACSSAPEPTADANAAAADGVADAVADSELPVATDLAPQEAQADVAQPLAPLDQQALDLALTARAASQTSATKPWPGPDAIWPGYPLHQVPLYLVAVDAAGKPQRGFLVGFSKLPPNAVPLPQVATTVARWDGGLKEIGQGETFAPDVVVNSESALLATYPPDLPKDGVDWILELGQAVFGRVRNDWAPIVGCGQTTYPRFAEAIALQVLEAAVLAEALTATDAGVVETRLKEWSALRNRSTEVTPLVSKRWRHYDSWFGTARFGAARLVRGTGKWNHAQYLQALAARLQAFQTVKAADFDTFTLANGDPGSASIELALRLGWNVEPAFRDAQTVYDLAVAKWGPQPVALVENAKKRHDWPAMQKLAAEVMAIPGVDPAP